MRYSKFLLLSIFTVLIISIPQFYQDAYGAITFDNSAVSAIGTDNVCDDITVDVAVDDVVVIAVGYDDQSISVSSISDDNGHTWTERKNDGANGGLAETSLWTTVITTTNTANTITVNLSGSSQHFCSALVYNGVDTTTPFNQATGDDQINQQTIALALTPADTGQITTGVCVGEWNSAHLQTFDGTATGTNRHNAVQGGSDKFSYSVIDMLSYTDTSAKDWTCYDQQTGRDIASSMI